MKDMSKNTNKNGSLRSKVFMGIGGVLILLSAALLFYNVRVDDTVEKNTNTILESIEKSQVWKDRELLSGNVSGPSGGIKNVIEIDGYYYVGEIEIPSISLKLPIMEEYKYENLEIAPCVFAGQPGQPGFVIAGHNYRRHFQPVKELPDGTRILFHAADGREFVYEVSTLETIGPEEVEKMISDEWDMTLFTCTYTGKQRAALRCSLISEDSVYGEVYQ